jgi:hypothetical protein
MGAATKQVKQNLVANIVDGNRVLNEIRDVEGAKSLSFTIRIIDAGDATGTVQWFVQDSSDGGQTWDDVVSSETYAFGASVTSQRFYVALGIAFAGTQGSAVSNLALTAGDVREGPLGSRVRIVEQVSSISGTPSGPEYVIGLTVK